MSVSRGKSSFGEEKCPSGEEKVFSSGKHFTLARNDAHLARNDAHDRGTMLKVRLGSSTNRVRSFVDGSCERVGMGR